MSLSTTIRRNDYTGNDSVSVYAYAFRVFAQTDLVVKVKKTSTGVITTLTLTTDYTVSGVGASAGGNVTLVSAGQAWLTAGKLSSGYTIAILRTMSLVQNSNFRNQGTFFPETHEDAFDYLTLVDQQQQDSINGSVRLPDAIPVSAFDPTLPTQVVDTAYAGSPIIVNPTGTGWVIGGSLTGVPTFYIQDSPPSSSPTTSQLSFWYNTAVDQMYIWCRDQWRAFA